MIKKIVIIALIVAAAAGFFVWNRSRAADAEGDKKYQTAVVERGTVTATVTATGTVSAVTTVQIGSQVSGVIARLHADFNSPVKEGQLIAELDPTPFEAQVEQRRADVEKAAIDLRNADINLKRQQRLAAEGLAPQAELDTALAVFDTAGAQVEQARAALNQAETNLSYTKITFADRRVVAESRVRRRTDGGRVVPGADTLHDRAGPDEDADPGRRRRGRHRPRRDRPAHDVHG
jgi:HlyD family secretion protein